MMSNEKCWEAVAARDAAYDGKFFYGVQTTGVYCRPSCASRRPLRRNVQFYSTAQQAEAAGLRPCLRCHPNNGNLSPHGDTIREVCAYIDAHVDEPLTLGKLARRFSLSSFHLQKVFKAAVGISPKEYQEAARLRHLKRTLRKANDVTEAVYDAGYGSSSRVYERVPTRFGMTPGQYRQGAAQMTIAYAVADSPLGKLLMAATDRGICAVQFGDSPEELLQSLQTEFPAANLEPMRSPAHPDFERWMDGLQRHLQGRNPRPDLPLDVRATAFQAKVWRYLQSIPAGEVRSYGEVARAIGQSSASRAVARACATNRIAVLVPCHRVIRGDGVSGGYRWGEERKRVLLESERAASR
jgi:AraC family transcriptional regulator of adaptative response/methylated-DNA-[protein]-cysteine methyltransferase